MGDFRMESVDESRFSDLGDYDWRGFFPGMRGAFCIAGFVMAASFIGFGVLLGALDFSLMGGLFTTLFIWALPGQVVFVDLLMREGVGLFALVLAVSLTAIRLLPLTVLVLSTSRMRGGSSFWLYLLAHFTAVTMWVISNERIVSLLPRARRLPWLLGVGVMLMFWMVLMTCIGYYISDRVSVLIGSGLALLTPSYFFIALFGGARSIFDYMAIFLGVLFSFFGILFLADGIDLLVSGVLGGGLTYLWYFLRKYFGRGGMGSEL